MAALRGVGEGLELLLEEGLPGFGRADDSGAPEWVPESGLVRVTEGLFSKLRAGVLTTALAASLLRCAGPLSFFALDGAAGVLAWGAREVMGTPESKNSSIYSTFNLPKQIHRIRWPEGLFSQIGKNRLD
jgi:hypothetical protein